MHCGISLYLGREREKNEALIAWAKKAGIGYAFTSLHIPEEADTDLAETARHLCASCQSAGIHLIADISPSSLKTLGLASPDELSKLGISHIRLDEGFGIADTIALSQRFSIVCNASTVLPHDIEAWRRGGADLSRFYACHNFYPKPYTALSISRVRGINEQLHWLGLKTMAFVPGNAELRGPLFEGLPTVEEHRARRDQVLLNMLELRSANTDIVFIGDCSVDEKAALQIADLEAGYVCLRAEIMPEAEALRSVICYDRPDSSDYVFRARPPQDLHMHIPEDGKPRPRPQGSISISNSAYLRYRGEIEIARRDLPPESRVRLIGRIVQEDLIYLPYITEGLGIRLIPPR